MSLALAFASRTARAQDNADKKAGDLAKASQNPIADLTSVPLQFNFTTGGGLGPLTVYNLNVQPVMPLPLGRQWSVIARTIVPYVSAVAPTGFRLTGIGDIVEEAFFTPTKPAAVTIGFGPIFSFPTATNALVQTGDWALGPTVVAVRTTGPWVFGALATQLWTVAADTGRGDINQLGVQPFINYNLDHGWSIATSPMITANFVAASGEQWIVPLGIGVTKITTLGSQPMSVGIQYYNNVVCPSNAGRSLIRFVASFLFPKPPEKKEGS